MKKYEFNQKERENGFRRQEMIIEHAFHYFMQNHMMEDLVRGDEIITDEKYKGLRPDIATKDTCIEIKVLLRREAIKEDENGRRRVRTSMRRVFWGGYKNSVIAIQKYFKRVILLVVYSDIAPEEQKKFFGELRDNYEEEINSGLEIWAAEVNLEPDGISLVNYRNETHSEKQNQ